MPTVSSRSRGPSALPDPELVRAVRSALSRVKGVTEIKMFGGIGFMLNGNLLVGASTRGLLLRVGKERQPQALAEPGTRPMKMRGRVMEGYVYVDPPITPSGVRKWVRMARRFVGTLPRKRKVKREEDRSRRAH
jgi:TfoX/Sxy family transcriptional regulator of competence genes